MTHCLCVGNGDLDLNTGFDADARDLLDDLRGRVQIDQALVDAHLEAIPRLGSLTARRLTRGDAKRLGGHANGSLHLERNIIVYL